MDHIELEELCDSIDLSDATDKAEQFEAAAEALQPGEHGWDMLHQMACDHWVYRGELDRARANFDKVSVDTDELVIDRLGFAAALEFQAGDTEAAQVALDGLLVKARDGRVGADTCSFVGGVLEERSLLKPAMRWYNIALRHLEPEDVETDAEAWCVAGRFRVRRELDLPMDRYDEVALMFRADDD